MADKFVTTHAGAKKAKTMVNDIFAIKQSMGEGLRDFLTQLNRVRMNLPKVSEGIAVVAFQNGLSRDSSRATRKLLSRLIKYPPTTWDRIHNAYCAEVQEDEDGPNDQPIVSSQYKPGTEKNEETISVGITRSHHPTGNETNNMSGATPPFPTLRRRPIHVEDMDSLERERMPPLLFAHNFCVSPIEIVYALEKLGTKVKWPPKMRSDPSTRKSDVFCEFHQERGHKIEDYITLRQEVVNMLWKGHLKELLSDKGRKNFARGHENQGPAMPPSPARTINMIIGGSDDASINGIKFTTTHKRSITRERYDKLEESIIFDESDADGLTYPHNDALVITLRTLDTDVKHIMVDDGSGAYIIHPRFLTQIRLKDKIVPRYITLIDFNNAVERTSGEITLPVLAGGMTLETTLHIMDQATAYNAIVGRPWIHPIRAIPSSLY
ncbi:uncharacterized protein [Nicotiana tomentosiformis]|uniref:uncharacterized protein n=1 Tax=Nicotiana tomentosiformis TaxID=4098 RepID=UPI00051BD483|nr:uncharacterized protein LOC104110181 [Nicotiana tomentosiformis]